MASMTMAAASLLPNLAKNPGTSARRGGLQVVAKASSRATEGEKVVSLDMKQERSNNGRRELVLVAAAAAAAACSIAKVAMAGEPKPGTPEAKKKYAPICVTMPTAKICHK